MRKKIIPILVVGIFSFLTSFIGVQVSAETINFQYQDNSEGAYLQNGVGVGNTYNYAYGQTDEAIFDDENYVNYQNNAFVKKSVEEVTGSQGLFNVILDVKGNQTSTPIDLVLVIDYSSSMTGEKLANALQGLRQFGDELSGSLANGNIRIGIVAYNRFVYSTNGFSTDINYLQDFLSNTAESHSGTFVQKGLLEGQRLLEEQGRPEAEKLFIHIGDNSANRSYLPVEGAPVFENTGEIIDYNGYHTSSYVKEFQTDSEQYYTTSSSSTDPNAIPTSNTVVTDATLGTIVSIKESGFSYYSVATAPSARGEYIGRNIASQDNHYLSIDENLSGLGTALTEIADRIENTIPKGNVTDPMGEGILLQGTGNFTPDYYQLQGWEKDSEGQWQAANQLLTNVIVSEENQLITISNLSLGVDERVTLTYQIRLNTESADFKGETWYLANERTTLDPTGEGELLDFPIPSIKAPVVQLNLEKKWENISTELIPDSIQYVVGRTQVTDPLNWSSSDILTLTKGENYQTTITGIPVNGQTVVLPKYNNSGEDFLYSIGEVNVPDEFESLVTSNGNNFVITNRLKEPETSTTESSSSTTDSTSTESTTSESSSVETGSSKDDNFPSTNEDWLGSVLLTFIGTITATAAVYILVKSGH